MAMLITIRPAIPSDAQAIATIHIASWRAAYINIVPQHHLDTLSLDDRITFWHRILGGEDERGNGGILVAEEQIDAGESRLLLGFVTFGAAAAAVTTNTSSPPSDEQQRTAELRAIYIDPNRWTKGIGQALWKAAQQQLVEQNFTSVVVNVFAKNERAMRFYRAVGFVGEAKGSTEVGGERLETLRMRMGLD
ncbi:acyl-CoA N-acyltransferase, partial [Aureobasidium melanogenum]